LDYTTINGQQVISTKGPALPLGVPIEDLRAEEQRQGKGGIRLPQEWIKHDSHGAPATPVGPRFTGDRSQ
jgi:hypothetical protein